MVCFLVTALNTKYNKHGPTVHVLVTTVLPLTHLNFCTQQNVEIQLASVSLLVLG